MGISSTRRSRLASDILRLVFDPELTHKGSWLAWLGAVFLSILNAVSILYADELFRWDLSFQIQNAETAEPSEWEMMKRYLSWTVVTSCCWCSISWGCGREASLA